VGSKRVLSRDGGFTLVELLVTMTIFAIASTAMYQILFNVAGGASKTESLARISDEARLGFNRMVRDTREGQEITAYTASPQSYTVADDFDGNGLITSAPAKNSNGDYEELTYSFDPTDSRIRLNGEVLMSGVECAGSCATNPVFDFASEDLRYDWGLDGLTTWQDLDAASSNGVVGIGNGNGTLDSAELPYVTSVSFNLRVVKGSSSSTFYARAQLRNKR
jgi:prepilin-type N-terminal cleavage/methylation domain-containing protein